MEKGETFTWATMTRFALRNQKKIKEAKGEHFLFDLIKSLTVHQNKHQITHVGATQGGYNVIEVQSLIWKKQTHQFALIKGGLYNVQRVAYFKTMEK
ncbi:MAG: hypothetical protein WCR71_07155 [Bacteroidales bacterium]